MTEGSPPEVEGTSLLSETDSLPKGIGDQFDIRSAVTEVLACPKRTHCRKALVTIRWARTTPAMAAWSETDSLPKGIGDALTMIAVIPATNFVRNGLTAERHW